MQPFAAETVAGHVSTVDETDIEQYIALDEYALPNSTMQVTQSIATIQLVEQQIGQLRKQDQESRHFYADRVRRCEDRINQLKLGIMGYLQHNGMKNIQTPNGTAYQRTVTIKEWPSDESLIAWAEATLPSAIRIRREPDKRLLGDHIKATGEIPEGYSERPETRVYIR